MGREMALAAAVAVLLAAPAFGNDEQDEVVEAMISEGAPPAQAACIVEKLGDDAMRIFTAADEDLTEDDQKNFMAAMSDCSDVDAGE